VLKAGGTYDLGDGWAVGGYVKGTNVKDVPNSNSTFYTTNGKDLGKTRLVAFVSKSF
jgi:hypothetical protein